MSTTANEQRHSNDYPVDSDYTDADDSIDLRQYILILRKYRWFILLTTAALTSLAAYAVSGMTPIYRATSTLLIETQQTMPMNLDELIGIDTTNSEYYQTQFEVLKSRKLAKRVLEELNLYEHREWYREEDKLLIDNSRSDEFSITRNPQERSAFLDQTQALEAEPIERQMAVNLSLIHI